MNHQLERMRALVHQAIAEAHNSDITSVKLVAYGETSTDAVRALFVQASQGTRMEKAAIVIEEGGSRFICWNCCGLRYGSVDGGMCPNCGDMGMLIPEEISFALEKVETA